jgi:N-acetylglutamate synthase-like GNAT family acetyltransferase
LEFQVRDARLTDIERISTLIEQTGSRWTSSDLAQAADLLRQLVYLPNAVVLVAAEGRHVLGVAVLALRPSVSANGLVGALDLLAIEPGSGSTEVTDALLREVIRSARNKGCRELEAELPDDAAESVRWQKQGFREAERRLTYSLARVPVTQK